MLNSPFIESQHVHGTKELPGEPKSFAAKGVSRPSRSPLNLTFLPDEFLKTWNPTFLIRHPAMMIPSLYRTCLGNFEMNGFKRTKKEPLPTELTTKWIRTLYDFYAAHFAESSLWPIVLDADDRLAPGALKALRRPLDADPLLGFTYGRMRLFGDCAGVLRFPPYDP